MQRATVHSPNKYKFMCKPVEDIYIYMPNFVPVGLICIYHYLQYSFQSIYSKIYYTNLVNFTVIVNINLNTSKCTLPYLLPKAVDDLTSSLFLEVIFLVEEIFHQGPILLSTILEIKTTHG